MTNLTNAGRWIGGAVLAGYILDISSNFFLQPMIRNGTGAMGLFGGAAEQPGLISLIVLIGMVSGVISLIWAALLCQLSTARPFAWLAFLYLGLKASSFGMGGSEIASYSIFRSIGDAMLAAPGSDLAKLAEPIWTLVTSQRDGLHFPHMLLGGTGAFVFYVILYQSRWIPRWLATAGLLATASQMTGGLHRRALWRGDILLSRTTSAGSTGRWVMACMAWVCSGSGFRRSGAAAVAKVRRV